MYVLSIYEIKGYVVANAQFFIWEFSEFDQFSKQMKE